MVQPVKVLQREISLIIFGESVRHAEKKGKGADIYNWLRAFFQLFFVERTQALLNVIQKINKKKINIMMVVDAFQCHFCNFLCHLLRLLLLWVFQYFSTLKRKKIWVRKNSLVMRTWLRLKHNTFRGEDSLIYDKLPDSFTMIYRHKPRQRPAAANLLLYGNSCQYTDNTNKGNAVKQSIYCFTA